MNSKEIISSLVVKSRRNINMHFGFIFYFICSCFFLFLFMSGLQCQIVLFLVANFRVVSYAWNSMLPSPTPRYNFNDNPSYAQILLFFIIFLKDKRSCYWTRSVRMMGWVCECHIAIFLYGYCYNDDDSVDSNMARNKNSVEKKY